MRQSERSDVKKIEDVDQIGAKKRVTFLDMLLDLADEQQQYFTDLDIQHQVDNFVFAVS